MQFAGPVQVRKQRRSPMIAVAGVLAIGSALASMSGSGSAQAGPRSLEPTFKNVLEVVSARPIETVDDIARALDQARSDKNLAPLSIDPTLDNAAQGWALAMAQRQRVFHDPGLKSRDSGWKTMSESVTSGGSTAQAVAAIIANPPLAAQLLNPKTNSAGVGLAKGEDGRYYITVRFEAQQV
jgi:uncharacterized protein YkwD